MRHLQDKFTNLLSIRSLVCLQRFSVKQIFQRLLTLQCISFSIAIKKYAFRNLQKQKKETLKTTQNDIHKSWIEISLSTVRSKTLPNRLYCERQACKPLFFLCL